MTPEQFKQAQLILGLDATRMAAILKTTPRTIRRWRSGEQDVPPLVAKVMDLLDKGVIDKGDLI